jgi:glycosyltransferase involved in cell wall biosynthesis
LDQGAAGAAKIPGKLIYASRPERGLSVLLESLWPRLKKARPDLRLHVCGYVVDSNLLDPALKELHARLAHLVESDPAIVNLGALSKMDYYRHLAEAEMMVYPSTFPEVSCLAVLEAQALGTAVLTSDSFALSESVVISDFKIPGRPASKDYLQRYVERALTLLDDHDLRQKLTDLAKTKIRARYCWDQVATEWLRLFNLALRAKESRPYCLEVKNDQPPARLPV